MPKSSRMTMTPEIEFSAQVPGDTPALVCLSCGNTMRHVRTIPKLGVRPKRLVFVCPSCQGMGDALTQAGRIF
jgi:hypothetical protein